MLLRGSPWVKAARPLLAARPPAPADAPARAFHPSPPTRSGSRPTPAASWSSAGSTPSGYDGANRAMRTHVFDPAGYPEDVPVTIAWGERDRLVGPPKPRAPPRRRPLPRPPRRRPHADLGRPRAGRPHPARGQRRLGPLPEFWRQLTDTAERGGAALIVERTENPQWLSNAYLVADPEAGTGVLIDGNDELGPLLERAERDGIEITHILVTHPHGDHVAGLAEARERSSATRRWSPTRRPRGRARRGGRGRSSATATSSRPAASRSRRSTPPATPPATSPSSSTAPTSSPPTSSSRARSAARWRPAPAASPTSRPR